jgi:hypothetical protein
VELFQKLDNNAESMASPTRDQIAASAGLRRGFELWKSNFRDLLQRQEHSWRPEEKAAANVIRIMQLGSEMGLAAYVVSSECDWDRYKAEYEQIMRLAEELLSYNDKRRTLSLDLGLIYPLHAVAWKCRHPDLRRKGLELLLRIPRQEWLFNARRYRAIFSRILEIEETYAGLNGKDKLPSEEARVHDFFCLPQPGPDGDRSRYAVTFLTKPDGLEGPWNFITEYLHLPGPVSDLPPSNLISCRRWANSDATDAHTAATLKATVFGPYLPSNHHKLEEN